MRDPCCADDWACDPVLVEQPGHRNLSHRNTVCFRYGLDGGNHLAGAAVVVLVHGLVEAVCLRALGDLTPRTGQLASPERRPGDQADALVSAQPHHLALCIEAKRDQPCRSAVKSAFANCHANIDEAPMNRALPAFTTSLSASRVS